MRLLLNNAVWAIVLLIALAAPASAESVSGSQERAASELLAAMASGDMQAVAFAVHPSELDRLRIMIVQRLRDEAARGESTLRTRLFGDAMPLGDIERQTSANLFRNIGRRLTLKTRTYDKLDGLIAERDGKFVHVVVKGRQPPDRGRIEVVELVTLVPYGKEWKAAIPLELEAQIDDLIAGRARSPVSSATAGVAGPGGSTGGSARSSSSSDNAGVMPPAAASSVPGRNTPEILDLIDQAEKKLVEGRCDRYYRDHLSPELRRTLSGRTLDALVAACNRSIATRELLIAALRIVRRTAPVFEEGGGRAVYDVEGQGLPYDRYVLERVDSRWFIAE
jgi:hypothetical protein